MRDEISSERKKQIREATERKKKALPKKKPIWKRADIDESKEYVLLLLKNNAGFREFEIREVAKINEPVVDGACIHVTEIIPMKLVLSGDVMTISENVKLTDGVGFRFDSIGRWLIDGEDGMKV